MSSTGKKSESSKPTIKTEPSIPSSSSAPPPPLPSPPWTELPDHLTANILQRLDAEERLKSAQLVCSSWWRACKNPAMWRVIDVRISRCDCNEFENICCRAVVRSQGQLVELKIAGPVSDPLMHFASERSSQLRCLTLELGIPCPIGVFSDLLHFELKITVWKQFSMDVLTLNYLILGNPLVFISEGL
ncbi:putative F-box/LRR-repeat protein 9 [Salvia divinorum]|uniref:F-box/LRR-repeat protein 9 n=1 Tax=Salvia divinorum TaxID=28513 RepID=A0ABD1HKE2_SALDI